MSMSTTMRFTMGRFIETNHQRLIKRGTIFSTKDMKEVGDKREEPAPPPKKERKKGPQNIRGLKQYCISIYDFIFGFSKFVYDSHNMPFYCLNFE